MSDNKEYEKLAGLTMDEAQVILLALYLADTQKTKAIQFDFEKLARLGGYGSGQSAVIKFSHARRKLDSFIPFVRPSKKRKRDDGLEDLTAKEMRFSSDSGNVQIGMQLFDPMDPTYYRMEPML